MSADIELTWEWPADRVAEQKLLVKIVDVKNQSAGFFGFGKTPSFAGNLPDPVTVKAQLMNEEGDLKGKTVELTLPKLELESVKANDYAVLGVVGSKICICIKTVDPTVEIQNVSCP
jgi:hypothetical protein